MKQISIFGGIYFSAPVVEEDEDYVYAEWIVDTVRRFRFRKSDGACLFAEEGDFTPGSEARFGQGILENGGLLDGFKFFGHNDSIVDQLEDWPDPKDLITHINDTKE